MPPSLRWIPGSWVFILVAITLHSPVLLAEDTSSELNPTQTRTLIWSDGTRYVGGVKDGKKEGKGTIFWQDGTRFTGQFKNDLRNGPGTLILPNGSVRNGYFENDRLVPSPGSTEKAVEHAATRDLPAPDSSAPDSSTRESSLSDGIISEALPNEEDIIRDLLTKWAAAWSRQDVPSTLSFYASDYYPADFASRTAWTENRRLRISKPTYIQVDLAFSEIEVMSGNRARVHFEQVYESSSWSDKTAKVIHLEKIEDKWKITAEKSIILSSPD